MTALYIDDIRDPAGKTFTILRSYRASIKWMNENGCPEYISFDHDLGDVTQPTGYDIAKWMVETDMDVDGDFIPADFKFNVHSANPVGAANITGLLTNYMEKR